MARKSNTRKTASRPNMLIGQRAELPTDFNDAAAAINCDSQTVRERIHRIQSNYLLLDELLTDMEQRIPFLEESEQAATKRPNKPR